MFGMMRIARFSRTKKSELRRHRFPKDDGAGSPHFGNDEKVGAGPLPCKDRRAECCWEIASVDDVLDADRNAAQGWHGLAAGAKCIAGASRSERTIGVDVSPRSDGLVAIGYSCKAR